MIHSVEDQTPVRNSDFYVKCVVSNFRRNSIALIQDLDSLPSVLSRSFFLKITTSMYSHLKNTLNLSDTCLFVYTRDSETFSACGTVLMLLCESYLRVTTIHREFRCVQSRVVMFTIPLVL